MHCKCIGGAYSANNVTEGKRSAVGFDFYGNYLLVAKSVFFGILGSAVNVTLCNDNAFGEFDFTLGTYKLASTGRSGVTRFTAGCGNAD